MATRFREGQVVTVFRSRLRDGVRQDGGDYAELAGELRAAAGALPGFVDFKTFVAEDGERVSVVTFASRQAHDAWRDDPRHRRAQRRGREEFYAEYSIQVGPSMHTSEWSAGEDA